MVVSLTANSDTFQVSTPSAREITLTRLFSAPRQLLFDALSKPEHVKQWWGILDEHHSVVVCEIDLRPGGRWRYVARGPRGEVCFYGEYRELDAPGRMVFTEIFEPFPDAVSLCTCLLSEEGKKTRLTLTALYPSQEVRDMVIGSGMEHGAAISYDRLEDVVTAMQRA